MEKQKRSELEKSKEEARRRGEILGDVAERELAQKISAQRAELEAEMDKVGAAPDPSHTEAVRLTEDRAGSVGNSLVLAAWGVRSAPWSGRVHTRGAGLVIRASLADGWLRPPT